MKTIICTGGRDYANRPAVASELRGALIGYPGDLRVIVGDCPTGADALVREWCADAVGVELRVFRADWKTHGMSAGPMRNAEMVTAALELSVDCAFAFPGGKGTADCVQRCEAAGIRVYQVGGGR